MFYYSTVLHLINVVIPVHILYVYIYIYIYNSYIFIYVFYGVVKQVIVTKFQIYYFINY